MYGTVARYRVKPGMAEQVEALAREFERRHVPGFIGEYAYRMDADPNEFYLAVLFESREAYIANAQDPEQDAFYRRLRKCLVDDPEWHDGEIAYASEQK